MLITLEIVRFLQAQFISWDNKMQNYLNISPSVQSSNLNEELGRVNYIFSDKTGTLTCNSMEFRKFLVGEKTYGSLSQNMIKINEISNVNFCDEYLTNLLGQDVEFRAKDKEFKKVEEFILCMALCHTVLVNFDEKSGKTLYNAASPDELALVNAAKLLGYSFESRNNNGDLTIFVENKQEKLAYKLLNVLEFTSERKRMSVILRTPDSKILLLTKGADDVIFSRLVPPEKHKISTTDFLINCGAQGLRTLVFASRKLSEEEYYEWSIGFDQANREIFKREEKISAECEKIEKNLKIIGATAIEDKLRENVGETIEFIKNANIKVWMLTGDKLETAINIAYSCKMISPNTQKIILDTNDELKISETLKKSLILLSSAQNQEFCLIITGDCLMQIINNQVNLKNFVDLLTQIKCVVGCRVSPKQKSEIVQIVKNNIEAAVTLAIGDGANDVNMINCAHVGVGIRGIEGQQAARASDYALTEFKHLKNLLFVHGREYTRKNALVICYMFYKNVLLITPNLIFAFYSGFSAMALYNDWLYQCFNTLFTSLPIIFYAIFDQEYSRSDFLNNPELFNDSRKGNYFNLSVFWGWLLYGFIQGTVIFMIIIFTMGNTILTDFGFICDIGIFGAIIFTVVIWIVSTKLICESNSLNIINIIGFALSITAYYTLFAIISQFRSQNIFQNFTKLFTIPSIVFIQAFCIFIFICYDVLVIRFISEFRKPKLPEIKVLCEALQIENSKVERPEIRKLKTSNLLPTGFAFSQESGHTPQLTSKNFRERKYSDNIN